MLGGFERFFWWVYHDPNAPAVFQAVASVLTVAITAILCWITYRYMVLTRHLVETTREQLKAALTPVLFVRLEFRGARDDYGGEIFKDQLYINIKNTGTNPLAIHKAVVEWEHSPTERETKAEAAGFRGVVISAGADDHDVVRMLKGSTLPRFDHFGSWSDHVSVTVECSDLGGISPMTYIHQNVTGLRLLE
jgi:hypothetical protein